MEKKLKPPAFVEKVYSVKRLPAILTAFSLLTVVITVSAFISFLIYGFVTDYRLALGFIIICGVPFVLLSLFRRFFNAKRPYEIYDFSSIPAFDNRKKGGRSFPSRHVFSAFVIGTALSFTITPVGIILCILGASLGACRVLLGIHFIRDVVAGALIGIISGIIGILIVNYGLLPIMS